MTYWISMPGIAGVTFSLEARDGIVIDASATARWTVGRAVIVALDHYRQQGARIDWINHEA